MNFRVTKARLAPLAIIAIAGIGSLGAYAAIHNWFNGTIETSRVGSVFTVDATGCPAFFPGIEPDQQARMQFKIVKDTGLTADALKQSVLQTCEFYAAQSFLDTQEPLAAHLGDIYGAKVKGVQGTQLTVTVFDRHVGQFKDLTLPTDPSVLVYDQAQASSLSHVVAGDSIVFAAQIPGADASYIQEGQDPPLAGGTIFGIFKTQYDMLAGWQNEKAFYEDNGIEPVN